MPAVSIVRSGLASGYALKGETERATAELAEARSRGHGWASSRPTGRSLKALLAPYPSDGMVCWPVSARVGNVKDNDPALVEPIVLS